MDDIELERVIPKYLLLLRLEPHFDKMNFLKEGKTNWKYILIVIFLAIFIGGGILWFSTKQEVPIEFPRIEKPEVVKDETADWEIFKSDRYGFKMKYPPHWLFTNKIVTSDIVPSLYKMTNKKGYIRLIPCSYTQENPAPIWLDIYFNPQKLDYINYGKEYPSDAIFKEELILGGGVKATKFALETPYLISKEEIKNKYIIITRISKEDLILELRQELIAEPSEATTDSIYYEGTNTYKNILSSLVFFEKNATVDWETLTREGEGFEIDYHKDWGFDVSGCNDVVAGVGGFVIFFPQVYIEEYDSAIQVSLRILNKYIEGKEFNPEELQCLEKCPESITYYIPNNDKSRTAEIQLTFQEAAWRHMAVIPLDRSLYPLSDIEVEQIFNRVVSSFRFLK